MQFALIESTRDVTLLFAGVNFGGPASLPSVAL